MRCPAGELFIECALFTLALTSCFNDELNGRDAGANTCLLDEKHDRFSLKIAMLI